jgi:outer membrane receptor for ferrienterochelin and colicins
MRKISFIIICCLLGNLYFSNAQNVKLTNTERKPLEGAIVQFSSLSQPDKSALVISNFKGEAWVLGLPFPLLRRINLMGFLERVDTIPSATGIAVVVLTSAPSQLGEVTVTGNHLPGYQKNAVVPVQVIRREDIERRGAVTVQDLLTQELNMRISFDPALGSSLTLQGTGGEHIKVLVDGVPVIGRQNGNIDLGQLNLSNIERVEVVKGPMSVLYGTDALGGVINLITKTPAKENWSLSGGSFYESSGQYNVEGSASLGLKSTAISLNGGRNYFDGWDPVDESGRSFLWNPREQYFGSLKVTQRLGGLKLTLNSSYFTEEVINKSEPTVTPYVAYATDQYYTTTRWSHQLIADKKFSNFSQLNFTGAYSNYKYVKNTYRKDLVALSEQLTADNLDDDTTVFNAYFTRVNHTLSGKNLKWSLLSGLDLNHEQGKGKKIDNSEHTMFDIAFYSSFDYKLFDNLTLRPSFRAIYNSQFSAPVIPSFSLMYAPGKFITARASVSMGYRAPSLKEQHLYFVDNGIHNVQGNPDLIAERSKQAMASLEFKKSIADFVLSVEPGFFYNEIKNKISLVQFDANSTLYTYVNLDNFSSRGFELKSRLSHHKFSVQGGVAYTGTLGTFDGDVEQPEVAWYPEVNASADYKITNSKTTLSLFWKYFGERPVFLMQSDGTLARFSNESFSMMDASILQPLLKDRIALTLGARNLLDVTNVRSVMTGAAHNGGGDGQSPVGMGTTYYVKLNITFK